ncbi:MAG: PEP-CTERM sorting domain-containing protein [Phycisphaerae bacterium]
MFTTRRASLFLALVLVPGLVFAGSAHAFVPWSNPNGTASFFDWANGGSDTGLFGSPTLLSDTFVFFPQNFRADSANGVPGSAADRLEFDLIAHAGFEFTDIVITEFGDYGILGDGEVSVNGTLFANDLTAFRVRQDNLLSNPPSPITSGSGSWQASAGINFAGDPTGNWTHMKIILDNNLQAITLVGGTSFIQKKITGAGVSVTVIPEPASLSLLAFGACAFLGRRRR